MNSKRGVLTLVISGAHFSAIINYLSVFVHYACQTSTISNIYIFIFAIFPFGLLPKFILFS
jgi:hypothetical protein